MSEIQLINLINFINKFYLHSVNGFYRASEFRLFLKNLEKRLLRIKNKKALHHFKVMKKRELKMLNLGNPIFECIEYDIKKIISDLFEINKINKIEFPLNYKLLILKKNTKRVTQKEYLEQQYNNDIMMVGGI
jgi:hypothetical protein